MNRRTEVWIVDDDESIRWVLEKALTKSGFTTRGFDAGEGLWESLQQIRPDVVLTDVRMPGMDGFTLLERIHSTYPNLPVIVMTAYADLEHAVSAFSGGAFEYLPKPFDVDDVLAMVHKALGATRQPPGRSALPKTRILGAAPAMQEVYRAIGRLAHSHLTVLITGESGTGKELVARALHEHSPRAAHRFIALNTAAMPRELLESELFGHERGAFTGAETRRIGRFEQADDGTLFLDEIGDMPSELQTRLLRVLSEGVYFRVGGHETVKTNVRVIAATHQPLESNVKAGTFRSDLYHRLNVIRIRLPALRERREDIPALLTHFLDTASHEIGVARKRPGRGVVPYLQSLPWPGNVRQLENVCRWLTVMAPGDVIQIGDLPDDLIESDDPPEPGPHWRRALSEALEAMLRDGRRAVLAELTPQFEETVIRAALRHANGKRLIAAQLLGWGRNTLTRKIHGLKLPESDR